MVRIIIVGREVAPVNYPENSNTREVKNDLKDAFGPGLLMRDGEGILSETLSGDYEFHVAVSVSPEQLNQLQARVTELAERVADMKSRDSIRGDDRLTLFSKVFRSTDRHSRASSKIRKSPIYDGRCAFCRTNTPPITISHIVAGSSDLDYTPFNTGYKTLLDVKSPRNFLPLCGTEGRYGTCHDEFDKFRITLLYNPFDQSYSIFCLDVNNSPKANLHGRKIEVDENFPPYRRLLAWRTRKCLLVHGGKMEDKGNSLFLLAKFSDQSKSVATNEEDEEDDDIDEGSTGSL